MYISLVSIPDFGQGTEGGSMSFVCAISVSLRGGGILNVASVAGVRLDVNLNLAMVLIVRYDFIAHDGWGVIEKNGIPVDQKKKSDPLKKKRSQQDK
jgi:hypothetical protein